MLLSGLEREHWVSSVANSDAGAGVRRAHACSGSGLKNRRNDEGFACEVPATVRASMRSERSSAVYCARCVVSAESNTAWAFCSKGIGDFFIDP